MTAPPHSGRVERKLAAIFAADVAGYSRLMSEDEAGTLRTLTAHREIMDSLISEHGGRIANTAGDSVLAEFPSVVDAVESAVAVQEKLQEANAELPEDKALWFRIGVHVGDVMVQGADLLGDGVNVAARVQALANPGGVWLSGRAYEQVEGKLTYSFEDRGEQQVKNIARPVRVYAIVSGLGAAAPSKALPLPDKPSIAVLPFTNMSGDPEQDYFADGLVEDIITALSRVKSFFVIARNSSFSYKGRAVDVRQVGRDLGVRYVLEGSIRKVGQRVRITGQLIEAQTGRHVWADRSDGALENVFELQDQVTQKVAWAIEPSLIGFETARARLKSPGTLEAYDLYLRALSKLSSFDKQAHNEAEALLGRALEAAPEFGDAWGALSLCLATRHISGWVDRSEPAARSRLLAWLLETCNRGMAADPDNGLVLANAARAHALVLGLPARAMELAAGALRVQPNSVQVRVACGWAFLLGGEIESALTHFRTANRFSPLDPRATTFFTGMGAAHFFAHRCDDAVECLRRALELSPTFSPPYRFLAAALGHAGRVGEARFVVDRLLQIQPESSISLSRGTTYRLQEMLELFLDGLRKAGLPE